MSECPLSTAEIRTTVIHQLGAYDFMDLLLSMYLLSTSSLASFFGQPGMFSHVL